MSSFFLLLNCVTILREGEKAINRCHILQVFNGIVLWDCFWSGPTKKADESRRVFLASMPTYALESISMCFSINLKIMTAKEWGLTALKCVLLYHKNSSFCTKHTGSFFLRELQEKDWQEWKCGVEFIVWIISKFFSSSPESLIGQDLLVCFEGGHLWLYFISISPWLIFFSALFSALVLFW